MRKVKWLIYQKKIEEGKKSSILIWDEHEHESNSFLGPFFLSFIILNPVWLWNLHRNRNVKLLRSSGTLFKSKSCHRTSFAIVFQWNFFFLISKSYFWRCFRRVCWCQIKGLWWTFALTAKQQRIWNFFSGKIITGKYI